MSGVFVAIVGPSGAGKDTLIRFAETELGRRDGLIFVRRLVTRTPGDFEDHQSLTEGAFADGLAGNHFAIAWRAHGHGYAVPQSALAAVRQGAVAVCNLSRGAVAEAERVFGSVVTVMVTAPSEVLAARLAARGRESLDAIEARLKRESRQNGPPPGHVIVNDGPVAAAGTILVEVIDGLWSRRALSRRTARL
jgi:ribose 1,5-bisphosphokinase